MRLYDTHNHLQDHRLDPHRSGVMAAAAQAGVVRMVVNGSCETDWPEVEALALNYPQVLPSFGYHPWYVKERTPRWLDVLRDYLRHVPSAIGEIGLDRWVEGFDLPQQEEVFLAQLNLAAEWNLPVSIHCLQAWGVLFDLLRKNPRPAVGFVLHSYGGPPEMIKPLAALGAYFSLPGYFAEERKARQRETFRHVPADRLLIETDAPDQLLPDDRRRYPLTDVATGKPINYPAELSTVYRFAGEVRNEPVESLAVQVEENFLRLFGAIQPLQ
ncbi:MAG TPA: TatD family hydrolase [Candidatus Dormibacteraeota bacterium]|nr:TatD family hydrolase [Candidatus Dormibacteraeota bacterium]